MATTIDKYVLETSVTGMKDVDALNTSVKTLGSSIDTVTAKKIAMTINIENLGALSNTIKGIDTSLDNIAKKIVKPSVDIASFDRLNATMQSLAGSINAINGKNLIIDTDSSEVNSAKRAVDRLDAAIDDTNRKEINVKAQVGGGIIGQNIDELKNSFNNFTSSLATGALAALAALGVNAVKSAGDLTDLSEASEITTSNLLYLKEGFVKAGGDADTFATVVNKMMDAINEAASGNDKFISIFKDLSVPIKDANGQMRDTNSILRETIISLGSMSSKTDRQRIATDLFGKSLKGLNYGSNEFKVFMQDMKLDAQISQVDKIGEAWDLFKLKLEKDSFGPVAENADRLVGVLERLSTVLTNISNLFEFASNKGYDFTDKIGNLSPIIKAYSKLADAIESVEKARKGDSEAPWWAKQYNKVEKMFGLGKPSNSDTKNAAVNLMDKLDDMRARGIDIDSVLNKDTSLSFSQGKPKDFQFGTPSGDAGKAKAAADEAERRAAARKKEKEDSDRQLAALKAVSAMQLDALVVEGEMLGKSTKENEIRRAQLNIQNNLKRDFLKINEEILQEEQKGKDANQYVIDNLKKQKSVVNGLASDLELQLETNNKTKNSIEAQTKALTDQYDAGLKVFELSTSETKKTVIEKEIDNQKMLVDRYKEQYEALRLVGEENGLLSATYATAKTAFDEYHANYLAKLSEQQALIAELKQAEKDRSESFAGGWDTAMKQMVESMKPAQLGAQAFNDLWGNIETTLSNTIATGKFEFTQFRDKVIADIALMAAKALASNLIGKILGTAVSAVIPGAGGSSIPGDKGGSAIFPRAGGGSVSGNQPYIVGERGPELFMPGQNGTVIPNRNLAGDTKPSQVINNYYNVSAVDGQSVARFFMENKNMVAAANSAAKKERS